MSARPQSAQSGLSLARSEEGLWRTRNPQQQQQQQQQQTVAASLAARLGARESFLHARSHSIDFAHGRAHTWLSEDPPEARALSPPVASPPLQHPLFPIPVAAAAAASAETEASSSWSRGAATLGRSAHADGEAAFRGEYTVLGALGEGATSSVLLGRRNRTGEYVAIKAIPKKFVCRKAEFKKIAKEIPILKQLRHRNIIRYHDVLLTQENLYIILEYAQGHELFDEIVQRKVFDESLAAKIVYYVSSALAYIHSKGIVHADLKPENVIVKNEGEDEECDGVDTPLSIKIIDFGLSHIQRRRTIVLRGHAAVPAAPITQQDVFDEISAVGSLGYKAPELMVAQGEKVPEGGGGPAIDMWALGVMTFIMLGGYPPFRSDPSEDFDSLANPPFWLQFNSDTPWLRSHIRNAQYEFLSPFWDDVSESGRDFVARLLRVRPEERMTAVEALRHPWIAGMCATTPRRHRVSPTRPRHSEDGFFGELDAGDDEPVITAGDACRLLERLLSERRPLSDIPARYFHDPVPPQNPKIPTPPMHTKSPLSESRSFASNPAPEDGDDEQGEEEVEKGM